jgi:uncharacterized protein YjdB
MAGDATTLQATLAPTNASNKYVEWRSDNPAVATVNSSGKVPTDTTCPKAMASITRRTNSASSRGTGSNDP